MSFKTNKMIDTVKIRVLTDQLRTINDVRFPKWELVGQDVRKYKRIAKNPTDSQKKEKYFPKLWKYARWLDGKYQSVYVMIEFSVPKLLFGNSLYEVVEQNFDLVIKLLKERLLEMGEIVTINTLENAEVLVLHASKNIILKDGYFAISVLKELRKINISKKFHLSEEQFKNDGHTLRIYTNTHAITFYDKIAELNQGNKSIDKDKPPAQKTLYLQIKKHNPLLEVLRMEVWLSHNSKLNSVLKNLGFKEHLTFKEVFKKDICRKIVLYYWGEVIKGENLFLFELSNNPMKLLNRIFQNNQKIKAKEAMNLVALSVLAKDDGGIRELRTIIEKRIKQRNWYTIASGIKRLNKVADGQPLHSWVKQIDDAVNDFFPITEKDIFQNKGSNPLF